MLKSRFTEAQVQAMVDNSWTKVLAMHTDGVFYFIGTYIKPVWDAYKGEIEDRCTFFSYTAPKPVIRTAENMDEVAQMLEDELKALYDDSIASALRPLEKKEEKALEPDSSVYLKAEEEAKLQAYREAELFEETHCFIPLVKCMASIIYGKPYQIQGLAELNSQWLRVRPLMVRFNLDGLKEGKAEYDEKARKAISGLKKSIQNIMNTAVSGNFNQNITPYQINKVSDKTVLDIFLNSSKTDEGGNAKSAIVAPKDGKADTQTNISQILLKKALTAINFKHVDVSKVSEKGEKVANSSEEGSFEAVNTTTVSGGIDPDTEA